MKNITMTFIATVECINFEDKHAKECVVFQASSYTDAAAKIEETYADDLEGIVDLHAISDNILIHLGDAEDKTTELIVDRICEENTF